MTREDEYKQVMGEKAAERQRDLARYLYPCCGEYNGGPRDEACRNYDPDFHGVAEIPGQETLGI